MDEAIRAAARLLWDYHCLDEPLGKADVIVGLGSYDLRVAERCAALFHSGLAPRVLFTGKSGHWTEERFDRSEAATFAARAMACGVPEAAVALEEQACNMGENIAFSAPLVGPQACAIFVTKPQTQRRLRAALLKQWPHAAGWRVTAPQVGFEDQPTTEFPLAHLIEEMVGDLWRIREYPLLGFQVAEEIPASVLEAYELLRTRGYDAHIPEAARRG